MPLVPNPGPPQGTHLGDPTKTQHTERQNIAGGREGDMPECAKAGVTANDDGRRPSSSEFGSYLYVVPHPLLPQTVLTVVTLLRANGAD